MITPDNAHKGVNIAVHIWILFVFLTIFFFTFVSKTEKHAVRSELTNIIKEKIPIVLRKLDKSTGNIILWNEIDSTAENIKTRYKEGYPYIYKHNNKLLKTAIIICVIGLFIIIGVITYFTVYKKYDIGLKEIILENIASTILIGIVEAVFFLYIALKFVPVTKTDLITDLIDRTKYQINKQLT